jgi:phage terminase small subunit
MAEIMTPKQQRFRDEYLIDLNATRAYRAAGYRGDDNVCAVEGHRLLSNPKIAASIQDAMDKRSKRTAITADKVLEELAKIGFSDIRRVIKWYSQTNVAWVDSDADMEALAEDGALRFAVANQVELVSSNEIDDDTAAAIAEVSMTGTGALKVKLHDKRGALVDLGRHLKLFTDTIDHTSSDGSMSPPTLADFYGGKLPESDGDK